MESDDKSNAVGIIILPPENVDWLKDDEEVQDNGLMIANGLPSHVCGTVQVQTNFVNGENNDHKMEDDDNAKEEKIELRAQNQMKKRVLELLKYVEECNSKPKS